MKLNLTARLAGVTIVIDADEGTEPRVWVDLGKGGARYDGKHVTRLASNVVEHLHHPLQCIADAFKAQALATAQDGDKAKRAGEGRAA